MGACPSRSSPRRPSIWPNVWPKLRAEPHHSLLWVNPSRTTSRRTGSGWCGSGPGLDRPEVLPRPGAWSARCHRLAGPRAPRCRARPREPCSRSLSMGPRPPRNSLHRPSPRPREVIDLVQATRERLGVAWSTGPRAGPSLSTGLPAGGSLLTAPDSCAGSWKPSALPRSRRRGRRARGGAQ
jgi:hypothetical protein